MIYGKIRFEHRTYLFPQDGQAEAVVEDTADSTLHATGKRTDEGGCGA